MPKKKLTFEEELKEPLRLSLERSAQVILKDAQHLCDDALSETYVKAWTNFSKFDPKKGTFSTWIHTILENTCNTLIRAEKKYKAKKGYKSEIDEAGRLTEYPRMKKGFTEQMEGESFDQFLDANTVIESLPDEDGAVAPQAIEDFLKMLEETGVDKSSVHIEGEPGERRMVYLRGDHWGYYRFNWDEKRDPPQDITLLTELVKGTPRKTIAKKFKKSSGTLDVAVHRVKKKIDV